MHPDTGEVWTIEHGPQGGDELNLMQPGVNYGWPIITYGVNYVIGTKIGEGTEKDRYGSAHSLLGAVYSILESYCFIPGLSFPQWQGNAFVSSLVFGQLGRLEMKR